MARPSGCHDSQLTLEPRQSSSITSKVIIGKQGEITLQPRKIRAIFATTARQCAFLWIWRQGPTCY